MGATPAIDYGSFNDTDQANIWDINAKRAFPISGIINGAGTAISFSMSGLDNIFSSGDEILCEVLDLVFQHTSPNPLTGQAISTYLAPNSVIERGFMQIPNGVANQIKTITTGQVIKETDFFGAETAATRRVTIPLTILPFKLVKPVLIANLILQTADVNGIFTGSAELLLQLTLLKRTI